MKGDLATSFNASFMALFPRPLWGGLLFLRLCDIPRHKRKSHWAKFWIFAYRLHHLSRRKTTQSQVTSAFAVRDATPSSAHQFRVACLFHSLHGRRGSSLVIDFYWSVLYAYFSHDPPPVEGLQRNCYVKSLLIMPGVD